MEQLTQDPQHSTDIAVTAAGEALTAREAHQKNITLLNALRKTQAEHSHRFDRIDERFDRIENSLGVLTVGAHSIESMLTRLVDQGGSKGHS